MKLQLIDGHFDASEAIEILTRLIHVKIKFHENKIRAHSSEEDIKMREKRIRQLQKELFEIRNELERNASPVSLESTIHLNPISHGKSESIQTY